MKDFYVPSVREILDNSAEKFGKKTFIEYFRDGELTEKSFTQVREDSLAVCRYLRSLTDKKLHIAIIGATTYEYLVFATGVLISGNVLIPFAPEISAAEASNLFERGDVDFIIHDNLWNEEINNIDSGIKLIAPALNISDKEKVSSIFSGFGSDSAYAPLSDKDVDKDELALMIYTSGTTGLKKGVMHSTTSFVANIMCNDYIDYSNCDAVALSVLPMHHVFCFSGDYIKNLKDGVTVALNGNMRDLPSNLKLFQPKVIRVVPMIAQTLLRMIKATKSRNPSLTPRQAAEEIYGKNIRWIFSGGAYLPPELCVEYEQFGIFLRQGYGMTEAGCRITIPSEDCSMESVGKVIDITDARTVSGEIQVKCKSLMLGYYKMPEETKAMFTEDGWLRTGDIGILNENNELFVTGRLKNLIILSSGENVSPEAIEKKFNDYDIVSEVLVYGENNRIVAEIYPDYDYCNDNKIEDPTESINYIVRQLNSVAKSSHIISEVRIRKTPLERTASGKIKRKETVI